MTAQKNKEVEAHHKWKEREYKDQPGHDEKKKDGDVDEFGNVFRPKFLSNHTHFSKTDPDARISVKPGKPRQMNYSAQTSVDTRAHVITNIMADFSDRRDSQSLPQAVEQTRENLEENDLHLKEVSADTGFSSGAALRYLKENNITGYIPNHGKYKNSREGFIYNGKKDQYECQRGNRAVLEFKKIEMREDCSTMKVFRSSSRDCRSCPLRRECIGKSDFKSITESTDKHLYDEMHERLKTQKARRLKIQRSSTVEPVLGTLINFRGMKRIWTRGIKNANKFMLGAAIAYNLKKFMNYREKKVKAVAMAMRKDENQSVMNNLFCVFNINFPMKKYFPLLVNRKITL